MAASLIRVLRCVWGKNRVCFIHSNHSRPMCVKAANEDIAPCSPGLSQQEAAVIFLLAKGKDTTEVAGALKSDEAAIKEHIKSVLGKLSLKPCPDLTLSARHLSRE